MAKKILMNNSLLRADKIIEMGLVGYWNSKSGVNMATKTWNNLAPATLGQYNATIVGGITQGANGLVFGVDSANPVKGQHVLIPTISDLSPILTFDIYTEISTYSGFPSLMSTEEQYLFYYNNTTSMGVGNTLNNAQDPLIFTNGLTFVPSTGYYITFIFNTTDGKAELYVNGVYRNTINTTFSRRLNNVKFAIGEIELESTQASYFPRGVLDNVRIYNRALTASEIMHNYKVRREVGL